MNAHLSDGEIRAYLDGEMAAPTDALAHAHLKTCQHCQHRAEVLAAQMKRVQKHLSALSPFPETSSMPVGDAYIRWKNRIIEKEKPSMMTRIFAPRYRPAWAVMAVLAILMIALAFPGVRALASDFLGLFRVQQFTVVQFDPNDVENRLGHSPQFEHLLSEDVHIEEQGEVQAVSTAEEAAALAGFVPRLPTAAEGELHLQVQPGVKATFAVDLERVRSLLAEIGRSDIALADELDGATVTLNLPTAVVASYGDCEPEVQATGETGFDPDAPPSAHQPCTTFVQLPSPSVSAPPELNFAEIGKAFLQLLGMTPEEAERFSQRIDWTTTLVVPIPRYSTTYQDVRVDGAEGVLIRQSSGTLSSPYVLMWIKEGMVYALMGEGLQSTALNIANSLK
jgi:hypothetical protein